MLRLVKNTRISSRIKSRMAWLIPPFSFKTPMAAKRLKRAFANKEFRKWATNLRSRHGQKGTIGMMYRQEDLPFTAEGIVPDLIVILTLFLSRMTIGHVFECVASKVASLLGIRVDATAFHHKPVDEICKMLKKAGYSEDGKEVMYHPLLAND